MQIASDLNEILLLSSVGPPGGLSEEGDDRSGGRAQTLCFVHVSVRTEGGDTCQCALKCIKFHFVLVLCFWFLFFI